MGSSAWFQCTFKRLTVPVVGQTGTEKRQRRPSDINNKNKTPIRVSKANTLVQTIEAQACSSLQHSKQNQPFRLPKQLVGIKSTTQVIVRGKEVNCLLDSGSQVTTVPESFYKQHLSEQEIKPLYDLLEVEGANGQLVPYFGYIEMTITFPKDFTGTPIDVNTLALIVPDTSQSIMLIGTNTLDVLFDLYAETDLANRLPLPHGYQVVFKVIELRRKQATNDHQGEVKMPGKTPQVIPAGATVVVEGVALVNGFQDEKSIVLEYPSSSPLPGGLLVKTSLVDFPHVRPHKLPVVISNISDRDIFIPAKSTIAEVSAYQTISLKEHSVVNHSDPRQKSSEAQSTLNLNFGDSPIPPEWKRRIIQQLNDVPDVFARHDLDFGRTDKVKHHIKLSDESPFKLRARPIHPQDIAAVRKHIQELLDAGVIRESE